MLVTSERPAESRFVDRTWSAAPEWVPRHASRAVPARRRHLTRRRRANRNALLRLLIAAYLGVAVLATVFATRQAALGTFANRQAAAAYQSDFRQWFTGVNLAQRQFTGAVTSLASGSDGRQIVGVSLPDGTAVRVAASEACLPTGDIGMGATVAVLRVPDDASVPSMFTSDPACLTPEDVTATSDAPQLPDYTPVRWYAALEVLALVGLTLTVFGQRRTMLRRRWGIGTARRDSAVSVGVAMMLVAVVLFPLVDTAAPAAWAFLRRHGM